MNYDGKHALVLGLGESGLAMAHWLARCGARVRVADTRAEPQRLPALRAAVPDAEFVGGEFTAALLDGVDFVAVSPGLAPERELAAIMPAAAANATSPSGARSNCSPRRWRTCARAAAMRRRSSPSPAPTARPRSPA